MCLILQESIHILFSKIPKILGSNITDRGTALMIGDRKYDILGAKTVGIDSAGVLYGYGDRAELEAAGADYILPAIPDLEELLLE